MAIETTAAGTVITGDHITLYDVLSFRRLLKLEIDTGMKFSNRVRLVPAAISRGYVTDGTRSKKDAFKQLNQLVVDLGGEAIELRSEAKK